MRWTHESVVLAAIAGLVGPSCTELTADSGVSGAKQHGAMNLDSSASQTVESVCPGVLEQCRWASTECSGDPSCANWYGCVLRCDPEQDLDVCAQNCRKGQSPAVPQMRLQQCLTATGPGPCSQKSTWDASTPSVEAGLYDETSTTREVGDYEESCGLCVTTHCKATIDSCAKQTGEDSQCATYQRILLGCVEQPTEADFEQCLSSSEQAPAAQGAHQDFVSSGAMSCVALSCGFLCWPKDYQRCLLCMQSLCGDAFQALLSNAEAQDYSWCRNGCKGDASCTSLCDSKYGASVELLNSVVSCQNDPQCSAECASVGQK